jgi:4-amino-4-deoxy-L-arabinose transferase-like glycosyltransferase
MPPIAVAIGLAMLGVAAFVPHLGRAPFYHLVEGDQSLVVQHIVHRGEWLFPTLNGDTLPSKPLLFNWLGALASVAAGDVSEATTRLPSALASAAGIAVTFAVGRRLVGPPAALVGAVYLLTTPIYAKQAREATTDAVLSFCLLSAFSLFYAMFDRRDWTGWRRVLFFLAVAGAALTKGPVGFALPALGCGLFILWTRDVEPVRRLLSGAEKWIAVALPLAWYAAATVHWGPPFVEKQFLNENLRRFTGGFGLPQSPFSLVIPSFTEGLPWSLLFLFALVRLIATSSWTDGTRFLVCWWGAILAVFSLAVGKRTIYLLPIYPAMALLGADQAWRIAFRVRSEAAVALRPRVEEWASLAAAAVAAVVLTGMARLASSNEVVPAIAESFSENLDFFHFLVQQHVLLTASMVALTLLALLASIARAKRRDWGDIPLVVALFLVVFVVVAMPLLRDRHKEIRSVKAFALDAAGKVPRTKPLYFYSYGSKELPGYLYFYFRRDIPPAPCGRFSTSCPPGFYLMWAKHWHEGDPGLAGQATLVARSRETAIWPRYPEFVLVELRAAGPESYITVDLGPGTSLSTARFEARPLPQWISDGS